MAKGYCTPDQVAAVLGVPLTPELEAALDPLIAAAEGAIDAATGHAWGEPGAHDEPFLVGRPHLFLRALPVVSVEAVVWLSSGPTTAEPTALDATGYTLLEPATGALWLGPSWPVRGLGAPGVAWPGAPAWVRVAYTSGDDVPPAVALACAEAAAHGYRRASDRWSAGNVAAGIRRYSVGQELTIEYAEPAASTAGAASSVLLPPVAVSALGRWWPRAAWA